MIFKVRCIVSETSLPANNLLFDAYCLLIATTVDHTLFSHALEDNGPKGLADYQQIKVSDGLFNHNLT